MLAVADYYPLQYLVQMLCIKQYPLMLLLNVFIAVL